jgi:transketolase
MRNAFAAAIMEMADSGADIHLLTADLGFKLFDNFREKYPDKFTNVGVSEPNMIGVAAGMALQGTRVFCYSMIPFLIFRTLDQIRSDIAAMRLPVTLVGVGAGMSYGIEGMTHHAIEDLAVMRAIPQFTIITPGDPLECRNLLFQSQQSTGPCYVRLGGNNDPVFHGINDPIVLGRFSTIKDNGSAAIITIGAMLARACAAAELLKSAGVECRIYSAGTLKPFDEQSIKRIASECSVIAALEDHSIVNGLGTAVAEVLLQERYSGRFIKIGLLDAYCSTLGNKDWLYDFCGLSPEKIKNTLLSLVQENDKQNKK